MRAMYTRRLGGFKEATLTEATFTRPDGFCCFDLVLVGFKIELGDFSNGAILL